MHIGELFLDIVNRLSNQYSLQNIIKFDHVLTCHIVRQYIKLLDSPSHFSKFDMFREPQLNTKVLKKLEKLYLFKTY